MAQFVKMTAKWIHRSICFAISLGFHRKAHTVLSAFAGSLFRKLLAGTNISFRNIFGYHGFFFVSVSDVFVFCADILCSCPAVHRFGLYAASSGVILVPLMLFFLSNIKTPSILFNNVPRNVDK